jgi:import inner membrane translocase subunit TIM44
MATQMRVAVGEALAHSCPSRGQRAVLAPHLRRASFIQQVMEQVKKDLEANEKTKKDWDAVSRSTERLKENSRRHEEHLRRAGERFQNVSSGASANVTSLKARAVAAATSASDRVSATVEQNEMLRHAQKMVRTGAAGSQTTFASTKRILGDGIDRASAAVSFLGDEHLKAEKLREWKAAREAVAAAQAMQAEEAAKRAEQAAEGAEARQGESATAEPMPAQDALVVSRAGSSSWDRFGGGLRDMPFLSSVFDNPLFDQLFGESEIAASIREMKEADRAFRLEDFAEDIEYVVAPHIISNFLEGDEDALQKHCGDAAFAAVNASIKARRQQKFTLDTGILAGPNELELKGAKLMENGPPCFIWTFNTQQVNCLRDSSGEIVEGDVDDIRTVHYAMAVTKHPNLDEADLEYPWQVSELAILGNQPCW